MNLLGAPFFGPYPYSDSKVLLGESSCAQLDCIWIMNIRFFHICIYQLFKDTEKLDNLLSKHETLYYAAVLSITQLQTKRNKWKRVTEGTIVPCIILQALINAFLHIKRKSFTDSISNTCYCQHKMTSSMKLILQ